MSCITCGLKVSQGSCEVIVDPQCRRFAGLGYDETTFKVFDVKLGFFTYGTNGTKSAACLWWHHIPKDSVYPARKIDYQAIAVFNGHKILSKDTIAVLRGKGEAGRWKQDMAAMERDMKKEHVRRTMAAKAAKAAAHSLLDIGEQPLSTGSSSVQGQRRPLPTTLTREAFAVSSNASIRTVSRPRPVQRQVPVSGPFRVTGTTQVMHGGSANLLNPVARPTIIRPAPALPTLSRPAYLTAQQVQSLQGGIANVVGVPIMPPLSARVAPPSAGPTMLNPPAGRQSTFQQTRDSAPTGSGWFDDPPPAYEPPPAYSLDGPALTARTAQTPQANGVVRPNALESSARPPAMNPGPAVVPSLPPPASTPAPLVTFEAPSAQAAPSDPTVQRRRLAGRARFSQLSRQTGRFANVDLLLPAAQAVLPATSQPFSFTMPTPASATATAPAPANGDLPAQATSSVSFRFDNVADNIEGAAAAGAAEESTQRLHAAPVPAQMEIAISVLPVPTAHLEAQVALALADSVIPTSARASAASFSAEEAHPSTSPGSEDDDVAVDVQLRAPALEPTLPAVAAARPTWFTRHFLQTVARLATNPLAQGRASFGWPSDST